MRRLILSLLLTAPLASVGHAADERCSALMTRYDLAERKAALAATDNVFERNTVRENGYKLEILGTLIERQINLSLMIDAKCPLPQEPATALGDAYLESAVECSGDKIVKGDPKSPHCDMSKWVRQKSR